MTKPSLTVVSLRGTKGIHAPVDCVGEWCCLHNPSEHPLNDAPMIYRGVRKMVERICEHGIGHPDPDDAAYRERTFGDTDTVHGCDGCCCE